MIHWTIILLLPWIKMEKCVGQPASQPIIAKALYLNRRSEALSPETSTDTSGTQKVNLETICGKTSFQEPRIFNGIDVSIGELPWQLSIQDHTENGINHQCGAVLIHPKWALTAGHCLLRASKNTVIRGGSNVVINKSMSEKSPPYWEGRIAQIHFHPEFNFNVMKMDIALFEINHTISVSNTLSPICLPPEGDFIEKIATVSGWGLTKSDKKTNILQKIELPVISNKMCYEWLNHYPPSSSIEDTLLCAGYENGSKDACLGDSGGPVQLNINQRWALIGIVSWGHGGCAKPYRPVVSTRVNDFINWIANVTKNEVYVPSFFLTGSQTSTNVLNDSSVLPNTLPSVTATTEVQATTIYNSETSPKS